MDPNQALTDARTALHAINHAANPYDGAQAGQDLADAFEALDEWITKGGFLPTAWFNGDKVDKLIENLGRFGDARADAAVRDDRRRQIAAAARRALAELDADDPDA